MRLTDLPTPGIYTNSQKLRVEAVKAISYAEIVAPKVISGLTGLTGGGGTGYTDGTFQLVFTAPFGSGASAEVVISGGIVGTPTILAAGSGYSIAPTVTLPAGAGAGTGATFSPTISTTITKTDSAKQLQDFFTAAAAALADYATA